MYRRLTGDDMNTENLSINCSVIHIINKHEKQHSTDSISHYSPHIQSLEFLLSQFDQNQIVDKAQERERERMGKKTLKFHAMQFLVSEQVINKNEKFHLTK